MGTNMMKSPDNLQSNADDIVFISLLERKNKNQYFNLRSGHNKSKRGSKRAKTIYDMLKHIP